MGIISLDEAKKEYLADVYAELERRGAPKSDIPRIIAKTGFMNALEKYPEEQLHYAVENAVDEILLTAALS